MERRPAAATADPYRSGFSIHGAASDDPPISWSTRGYSSFDSNDRRLSFPRHPLSGAGARAFTQPYPPQTDSAISIAPIDDLHRPGSDAEKPRRGGGKPAVAGALCAVFKAVRSGNRQAKRLAVLITLNVAYSTAELMIGLVTGRVGLVSDAFHLTFGCGLLTFSLFAMVASTKNADHQYTYGYRRLEVLSAFTNAIFLLFMSFSLAVEALHAFIQDESDHKHYLIVSAVTNLLVNLLGVWFFQGYARVRIVYQKPEDMNLHSVCLHVLADSIRSAGLILASWLLSLGVENAEVLCLGLVSVTVFMVVQPLFRSTGSILLQMAPANIPASALNKCWRQVSALDDVTEVSQGRFWELVPGYAVGSVCIQVKEGADHYSLLQRVRGLYYDLGIKGLTVQTNCH